MKSFVKEVFQECRRDPLTAFSVSCNFIGIGGVVWGLILLILGK